LWTVLNQATWITNGFKSGRWIFYELDLVIEFVGLSVITFNWLDFSKKVQLQLDCCNWMDCCNWKGSCYWMSS
jgi:hypothetical protein